MVEIEINGSHNEKLHFRPLQRAVRGRFDLNRIGEPLARLKASEYPLPIPSQRLGIDDDGTGYVGEPLHDAEHAPLREQIERMGYRLPPARETFEHVHAPSWLHWIKRAVESGLATVTKGEIPDDLGGVPRLNFILAEPEPTAADKLTRTLDAQAAAFDRLASAIESLAKSKR